MIRLVTLLVSLAAASALRAEEFRHFANFMLQSRVKITGAEVKPIPTKPILFHVATDGVRVRVSVEGDGDGRSTFDIYRSDGIARQISSGAKLDIIPGLQATSNTGGVLRHLRLTRDSLTITTFPGRSDQTTVTHAVATAAEPSNPKPSGTVSIQSNKP